MKPHPFVILFCLAVIGLGFCGPGCAAWTPEARLAAGRDSFNASVHVLATFRQHGAFTVERAAAIDVIIHAGQKALDDWQQAIWSEKPTMGPMQRFRDALRKVVAAQAAAEHARDSPEESGRIRSDAPAADTFCKGERNAGPRDHNAVGADHARTGRRQREPA